MRSPTLLLTLLALLLFPGVTQANEVLWIDLAGQLGRATKPGPPQVTRAEITSSGDTRQAIFQHAAAPNQAPSQIRFPAYELPALSDSLTAIHLKTAIGFKDGAAFIDAKSDGCIFIITANGKQILKQDHAVQSWREIDLDLSVYAGKKLQLVFSVLPKKNTAADWASWATPGIWVAGDSAKLEVLRKTGTNLPKHWPIATLRNNLATPDRTFRETEQVHIAVMDEHLDLATATERIANTIEGKPPVPLAPEIVVGEGRHPDNHTLVKVLGEYGIAELQFLAFPPEVRGGVWVEGLNGKIAATPISAKTGEVRIFDRHGALLTTLKPNLKPPLLLASGDFTDDEGDELAIASRSAPTVLVYSQGGKQLNSAVLVDPPTTISSAGEELLAYTESSLQLSRVNIRSAARVDRKLDQLPLGRAVFPTVFNPARLWAGGPQHLRSHVHEIKSDGSFIGKDLGQEENQFWLAMPKDWEQHFGPFEGKAKAKHIRFAEYGHIRVDATSPRYATPDFQGDANAAVRATFTKRGFFKPLGQQKAKMWNPTFTHRMFPATFRPWAEQTDPRTGLNRLMQQNADGQIDGFGQWDQKILISSTYAPGATELQQHIYTDPLRTFLRAWSPQFRQAPWLAPSIEPNHEFESVIATGAGVGDYNPHMIEGLFEWLVRHYGDAPHSWEKQFGVRFTEYFDAPRGQARASWDRYSPDNPWLRAWVEYNRHVINRSLALSYREALLAGIPPEMIRSHQIPCRYATAPLLNGITRITPIDYATTAGIGFGFTKFGTNYDKPQGNIIQAAKSSGFDSFTMGEFQPLTTDADVAEKELRYVFDNGAKAIHPLYWGANHTGGRTSPDDEMKNRTVYDAIQKLVHEDPPRSGQAGGIGQVRPYQSKDGKQKFNIVSVGTGPEHRGLLKSVRNDGKMEGTIYAIPFHQHIKVTRFDPTGKTPIVEIPQGSQIEITGQGETEIRIFRHGIELVDLAAELTGNYRYSLRFPERCEGITVQAGGAVIDATLQTPLAADIHTGRHKGTPHQGGISFDLLR